MAQQRYDVATNGYSFRLTAYGPLLPEVAMNLPEIAELADGGMVVSVVFAHKVAGHDGCTIDRQVNDLAAHFRAMGEGSAPGS